MWEWAAWEAVKFVALYVLLLRALSKRQVGMDGEMFKPMAGWRTTLKNCLQRLMTRL